MKYLLSLFLIISSICFAENRKDIAMVNRHVNDFVAKKSKEGYYLIGNGGEMMGNIQRICLDFDLHQHADIVEARKRIIGLAEEFLTIINQDEALRPYLCNYPFDYRNVGISIMFKDKNNDPYEDLALVMNVEDRIGYSKNPGPKKPFEKILREKYVDALAAVKEGRTDVPKLEMPTETTRPKPHVKIFELNSGQIKAPKG